MVEKAATANSRNMRVIILSVIGIILVIVGATIISGKQAGNGF